MPATGALIGTPASIIERAEAQTLAIEVASLGQPRQIREAITRLGEVKRELPSAYPVAVAQYISPQSGALLKRNGLAQVVSLAGPNTKIIPGHGPTVNKTAVSAQRDLLVAVRDRVAKLVAQGQTQEQVVAAKVLADYDSKVEQPGTTGDRFVGQLYGELKGTK